MNVLGPIPSDLIEQRPELLAEFSESSFFRMNSKGQGVLCAPSAMPSQSLKQIVQTIDVQFIAFLHALLTIDPKRRLSAAQALRHPWLSSSSSSSSYRR